jgi:hypothetical protein
VRTNTIYPPTAPLSRVAALNPGTSAEGAAPVRRISMLTPRTRRTPATTNDDAAAQRPQEPPYRPAREAALVGSSAGS